MIIKRLYTFMLERFLPLLAMTFFICLFIVIMQFLWRFIDELVGKGLAFSVIAELFYYAALSMVPTALPLAVLLASLMTFGNLGEKFELTAIKAAGISLIRVMKPLIILMVIIAVGAFYFQNYVLPVAQTKMWTLIFSMRAKSPEVEIPVKTFYSGIPRMSVYIDSKDPETGTLYGMILYDMTNGQENKRVILADSGHLNFTEDKTRIFLHLYNGELFENMRDNSLGSNSSTFLPFRRESFTDKQIYLPFDANFNRIDEGGIRKQYVGQNIAELTHSMDSLQQVVDSLGYFYGTELKERNYVNVSYYEGVRTDSGIVSMPRREVAIDKPIDIDSLFSGSDPSIGKGYIATALSRAKQQKQNYEYRSASLLDQARIMRRHDIERQRKFTLSFACLIFFFIGAPLGAIIKKGGIGTPLVISVFFFIVYFIVDNMGYKFARDDKMAVWAGVWLSSITLLPMGVFFTYKAVGDSQVFNIDAYINFFNRIIGKKMKRTLQPKEVIMTEVDPTKAEGMLETFAANAGKLAGLRGPRVWLHFKHRRQLAALEGEMSDIVDYLSNSRDYKVIALLNEYPFELNIKSLPGVIDNTVHIIDRLGRQKPEA